jgi:transcriptional antiterminator RfaH
MSRWYAVHCEARMETWARANLWQRGLEVYLPCYHKRRRHARRSDWVTRPLFPGYLFVRADLEAGDRRRVDSAPGVRRMVSFGDHTPAIADNIIEEIRGRQDADGLIRLAKPARFRRGEALRIAAGALSDQIGLFQCASDDQRVFLLLDLLGRKVRVRVPADQVSREA